MRESTYGGARLLVVDDNKVNRLLLMRNLELQGHRVASAESGRVAWRCSNPALRWAESACVPR